MEKRKAADPYSGDAPVRLVALSDGLFATVLTLLVLDLRIPDTLVAQGLSRSVFLKAIGPHLFVYLLTFFVAGTYWMAHHRNFNHVVRYDRGLLGYNLLFLLFIGLLPFSTATMGLLGSTTESYSFYWALYAGNIIVAGIMLSVTWMYALSHGQVDADLDRKESRRIIRRQLVTPAVFLLSIVAEYLAPRAVLGPNTLILIPLAQWLVERSSSQKEPGQPAARVAWTEYLWRAGTTLIWILVIILAVWAWSS